jgi:hypothetical protein
MLSLIPSDEEAAIRASITQISGSIGPHYARDCYETGNPPTAAWTALAEAGFVGTNIAEKWGGGSLGMRRLQVAGEEIAARGLGSLMLVVSNAAAGTSSASTAPRRRRIAGCEGLLPERFAWRRDYRAGRRDQHRQHPHRAGRQRRRLRTQRPEDIHLRRRGAQAVLVIARFRHDDGTLGKPIPCIVDATPQIPRSQLRMPYTGPGLPEWMAAREVAGS